MAYLKKPKVEGKVNVEIRIKHFDGTVLKMTMEECDPDKVNAMIGGDVTSVLSEKEDEAQTN
jgi:hypothetical protein